VFVCALGRGEDPPVGQEEIARSVTLGPARPVEGVRSLKIVASSTVGGWVGSHEPAWSCAKWMTRLSRP
jgi:hypothetical protein